MQIMGKGASMETANKEEKGTRTKEESKGKKRTFWSAFLNFLSMGGFLVILVVIVLIVIAISALTKK